MKSPECPECGNRNREGARFCDSCGTRLAAMPAPAPPSAAPAELPADLAPPPPGSPESIGSGRFEIAGFLGEGSRKRVFLARDRTEGMRLVAVAEFSTEGMGATAQVRARREAAAMAELGAHPNLVPVICSGEDEGRPFIASEYMSGGDLGELLGRSDGRRLDPARAVAIAADVSAGLAHAHSRGMIHRDIKPANVWLDADGSARLGDFGLARTAAQTRESVEGMVVGTAAYLPPEQAIGRECDERADLYSLGAILYEMVTGQQPFPGDDPVAIITRHISADPVPPGRVAEGIPARLERLVLELLAKQPAERPGGAVELIELLAGALDDGPDIDGADGADGTDANPLEGIAGGIFVGRERELEQVREVTELALEGRGGAVMFEGEPGIGKTRMLEHLATYSRLRGLNVFTATCQGSETLPPYWPFIMVIREYARSADPVGLAWQLGSDGPELARLVPELREIVPSIGRAEAPADDGEGARFRLFEAIARLLEGIATSRPLVLVLDDLHWVDSSSLGLIRYLGSRVQGKPMLMAAAYREEEALARPELIEMIDELSQLPNRVRIHLTGLGPEAVAEYFRLATGEPLGPARLAEVCEQTGGNPFFVGEIVRLIATEGSSPGHGEPLGIPSGVREAIDRRLAALPPGVLEVLEIAATAGRRFDPELIAAVASEAVEPALSRARAARIVESAPGSAELQFAHSVFIETLVERIETDRAAGLHRLLGQEIERRAGSDRDAQLPALANHFHNAGAGFADEAFSYSLAAGRQAAAQAAHAAASEHLGRALATGLARGEGEIDLRLELGGAMIKAGHYGDARELLFETAAVARKSSDPARVGQVAMLIAETTEIGFTDDELVELLREGLRTLEEADADLGLQARLTASISLEDNWTDMTGEAKRLAERSVTLAAEAGDDGAMVDALVARMFTEVGFPRSHEARAATAAEIVELSRRVGDRRNELRALANLSNIHLSRGDVEGSKRLMDSFTRLAERVGEPRNLWHVPVYRSTLDLMAGRFDQAIELSAEAARMGAEAEEPLAAQFHALKMGLIRSFQGRPEEMLPQVRRMVERYPAIPAWRLALIAFLVDAGRRDEALAEFEPFAARGFAALPRDANWLTAISRIAEVAAVLDQREAAEELFGLLEPFEGEVVVVGRAAAVNGPMERYLGLLARTLGDYDRALDYFVRAGQIMKRMGERPLRIQTRLHGAETLLMRDGEGDRERAFELSGRVLEEGQALGMRKLVESIVRLRLELQGVAGVDANASIDSVALAVADERPDMVSFASEDGRVCILFSDIESSTLMTERLGDERWIEVLRRHNGIFRNRLGEFGGYEVKNQGDGFMLAFPDPAAALRCAAAVQRDLEREGAGEPEERVRVRMGLHVGEVIEEEGDFFGRSVILAARIAAQAVGGEVLVSEDLETACGEGFEYGSRRELELKGLAGTHRVAALSWDRAESVA